MLFLLFRKLTQFCFNYIFIFIFYGFYLCLVGREYLMHVLTVNTVLKFDTSLKNVIKATVGKKLYLFFLSIIDNRYLYLYILNTLN